MEIVGQTYQKLERVDPGTYIGKGKLDEIHTWLAELQFDLLVFDDELSPRQQRNIEEFLGVRVLDRTALILDIFAQHAHTREGTMQVELAQYEYLLPRLTHQWAHLNRQVAAGGGRRGRGARWCGIRPPGSLGAGLRGPVKPSSRPTGVSSIKDNPTQNAIWNRSGPNVSCTAHNGGMPGFPPLRWWGTRMPESRRC